MIRRSFRFFFIVLPLIATLFLVGRAGANLVVKETAVPITQSLPLIGHFGGASLALARSGDYLYLARGVRLLVLHIADATNPVTVWRSGVMEGSLLDLEVDGNRLAVNIANEITLFDITNPASPVQRGSYIPEGDGQGFHIAGNFLFVTEQTRSNDRGLVGGGLRIVDISDLTDPQEVASYLGVESASDVVVIGNYAYVTGTNAAGRGTGVAILLITPSGTPVEVALYDTDKRFESIGTDGANLYLISTTRKTFTIQSLANPTAPITLGSERFSNTPYLAHVSGAFAFVTHSRGYYTVDISDLSQPVEIDNYDPESSPGKDLIAVGNALYFAYEMRGLYILDITSPANPILVDIDDAANGIIEIVAEGNLLYARNRVGSITRGLAIYDIFDPNSPSLLSETPGGFSDLVLRGDYLYHADFSQLMITDISDPAQPVAVGSLGLKSLSLDIVVDGQHAYIGEDNGDLTIVDISDPASPTITGQVAVTSAPIHMAIVGDYVFMTTGNGQSVEVVNVTDKANPRFVTSFPLGTYTTHIVALENHIFLSQGYGGMHVVDITNPALPSAVDFVPLSGTSSELQLIGTDLYFATREAGLHIVDVTDPLHAVVTHHAHRGDSVTNLALSANWAIVTDIQQGIYTFSQPVQVDLGYLPVIRVP